MFKLEAERSIESPLQIKILNFMSNQICKSKPTSFGSSWGCFYEMEPNWVLNRTVLQTQLTLIGKKKWHFFINVRWTIHDIVLFLLFITVDNWRDALSLWNASLDMHCLSILTSGSEFLIPFNPSRLQH